MPNPAAQALESGRTRTIALLVPDITNPYFSGVIKGAERAAAAAGLTLVLGDTAENPAAEEQLVRRLGAAVDGFVLSASRLARRGAAAGRRAQPDRPGQPGHGRARLRRRRLRRRDPADRRPPRLVRSPVVRLRRRTGRVLVGSPPLARAAGCRRGARDGDARRFGPYMPTLGGGPAAADACVASGATAVVVPQRHAGDRGDAAARRARRTAFPSDVSVVGFDNIFGADFCHPTLTTLAERTEDAGARAVEAPRPADPAPARPRLRPGCCPRSWWCAARPGRRPADVGPQENDRGLSGSVRVWTRSPPGRGQARDAGPRSTYDALHASRVGVSGARPRHHRTARSGRGRGRRPRLPSTSVIEVVLLHLEALDCSLAMGVPDLLADQLRWQHVRLQGAGADFGPRDLARSISAALSPHLDEAGRQAVEDIQNAAAVLGESGRSPTRWSSWERGRHATTSGLL